MKLDDAAKELVDEATAKLVPALGAVLRNALDQLMNELDGLQITVTVARKTQQ